MDSRFHSGSQRLRGVYKNDFDSENFLRIDNALRRTETNTIAIRLLQKQIFSNTAINIHENDHAHSEQWYLVRDRSLFIAWGGGGSGGFRGGSDGYLKNRRGDQP